MEITNSSQNFMKISEEKRKRTDGAHVMWLPSLLNNLDKPRTCYFLLLWQEENRTEITDLRWVRQWLKAKEKESVYTK